MEWQVRKWQRAVMPRSWKLDSDWKDFAGLSIERDWGKTIQQEWWKIWSLGRPKNTWRKCIEQNMNILGVTEELAQYIREWKRVIACPIPLLW